MPFVSKEKLGGEIDKNINTQGRIKGAKRMTNRELREREFMSLLRKLKPLVADSINTAAKIMKNAEATDQNKLKAAVILLDNYKAMVGDVYNGKYDEDEAIDEIQQPNVPSFSLKVVGGDESDQYRE